MISTISFNSNSSFSISYVLKWFMFLNLSIRFNPMITPLYKSLLSMVNCLNLLIISKLSFTISKTVNALSIFSKYSNQLWWILFRMWLKTVSMRIWIEFLSILTLLMILWKLKVDYSVLKSSQILFKTYKPFFKQKIKLFIDFKLFIRELV